MQANTTISPCEANACPNLQPVDSAGHSASRLSSPGANHREEIGLANGPHDFAVQVSGKFSVPIVQSRRPYIEFSPQRKAVFEFMKRTLDVLIALTLLLVTLPLFVFVAMLVKLTSRGPVFFKHQRLGRDGQLFWCFKFRTMRADAEERLRQDPKLLKEFEASFKIKGDPRITPLGALLRKTSLDELPQLIQVLRGEMSLVGPRPIVLNELAKYTVYGEKLLSVRPGLSGLWQICGRSEVAYPERVVMDMYYIDNRCSLLDLQLILLTPFAVIRGHGAR